MPDRDPVEAGYDAVYASMPHSPTLRKLWREHAAGPGFPDEFAHISFVTLAQLQRMAGELRLGPGDTLVDLGCGMGEAAVAALSAEMSLTLERKPYKRRVFAAATRRGTP